MEIELKADTLKTQAQLVVYLSRVLVGRTAFALRTSHIILQARPRRELVGSTLTADNFWPCLAKLRSTCPSKANMKSATWSTVARVSPPSYCRRVALTYQRVVTTEGLGQSSSMALFSIRKRQLCSTLTTAGRNQPEMKGANETHMTKQHYPQAAAL